MPHLHNMEPRRKPGQYPGNPITEPVIITAENEQTKELDVLVLLPEGEEIVRGEHDDELRATYEERASQPIPNELLESEGVIVATDVAPAVEALNDAAEDGGISKEEVATVTEAIEEVAKPKKSRKKKGE